MMTKISCLLILATLILGCSDHGGGVTSARRPPSNDPVPTTGWNIPVDEIVSTSVTKDAIPSLSNPITIPAGDADYLGDED
ncbi:DUF3179 domain-containing protein, partial [bacterium]|nr:DUF3179 domain-containing protein [bacterium]